MAWSTPKINWLATDYINYTDYNRIKANVQALYDSLILYTGTTEETIYEETPYNFPIIYGLINDGQKVIYDAIAEGENGEKDTIYIVADNKGYDVTFNGVTTHSTLSQYRYVPSFSGTMTVNSAKVFYVDEVFEIPSMGDDKAVNNLWYADEFNTIIENLDIIAEHTGADFPNKPIYSPNGHTPTNVELNSIERRCQIIYNRINRTYRIYLGQGGYIGARISNRLL